MNKVTTKNVKKKIDQALEILKAIGLPRQQQNDRSALTLLALIKMMPNDKWANAKEPLIGITPIMDFIQDKYGIVYKPNTRETIRRHTMHQFVAAGIAISNPDQPNRPVNSPKYCYQIAPDAIGLLRSYGSESWAGNLVKYMAAKDGLAQQYAKHRNMQKVPVELNGNKKLKLTPGKHSQLIRNIIEQFAPRYAPGAQVLYVGDTGSKMCHYDKDAFESLGLSMAAL